MNENIECIGHS